MVGNWWNSSIHRHIKICNFDAMIKQFLIPRWMRIVPYSNSTVFVWFFFAKVSVTNAFKNRDKSHNALRFPVTNNTCITAKSSKNITPVIFKLFFQRRFLPINFLLVCVMTFQRKIQFFTIAIAGETVMRLYQPPYLHLWIIILCSIRPIISV